MVEIVVALQQAEPARMLVLESRYGDVRWIVELLLDVLAAAGPHGEAVGSCTSGRQSIPARLTVSEYQYIVVSGARPSRSTACLKKSAASISMTTPLVRSMTKRQALVMLGPSSRAKQ